MKPITIKRTAEVLLVSFPAYVGVTELEKKDPPYKHPEHIELSGNASTSTTATTFVNFKV